MVNKIYNNFKKNNLLFFLISFQLVLFTPFLFSGNLGPDWDSYATVASGRIFVQENIYIPSRPPGFPLYEIYVGVIENYSIRTLLLLQFIFGVVLEVLIIKKFLNKNSINYLLIFLIFTSHVYLVSMFTVIDYILGTLFGFLHIHKLKEKNFTLASIFLVMSCAVRLSNLIFLIAGMFIYIKDNNWKKIINYIFPIATIALIYFPSFNLAGSFCFLNLTNIDHDLSGRLGRFIYKQLQIFGVVGTSILFLSFLKSKNFKILFLQFKNLPYVTIFVLFQLSFLRLPTEKGHLIPAIVAMLILFDNIKIEKFVIGIILFSSVLSNFYAFEFLIPDIPNHASSADFQITFEQGYMIKYYNESNFKGQEYENHVKQGILNIKDSWKVTGPNCK